MSDKDDLSTKLLELVSQLVAGCRECEFPVTEFFITLDLKNKKSCLVLDLIAEGCGEQSLRRLQTLAISCPKNSNTEAVMTELAKHLIKCAAVNIITGLADEQLTTKIDTWVTNNQVIKGQERKRAPVYSPRPSGPPPPRFLEP
jgi:hypothetical protein